VVSSLAMKREMDLGMGFGDGERGLTSIRSGKVGGAVVPSCDSATNTGHDGERGIQGSVMKR
jgi:hypothetical protein